MHKEALDWVYQSFHILRTKNKYDILEIGSLNINGSVRNILEPFAASYLGIDMQDGPGVDLIADGATYELPEAYDVIVTAETFEHTPDWKQIIKQSYINLKPNGIFIATMAGEGRPFHSGIDGNLLREHEHYANIGAWDLKQSLKMFDRQKVDYCNADLRCWSIK